MQVLESGRLIFPTLFISFEIVLATIAPMSFHMNCRLILSISTKNLHEILTGIALNLYIHLGKIDIFITLTLPIQNYGFHLFRSFFIYLDFFYFFHLSSLISWISYSFWHTSSILFFFSSGVIVNRFFWYSW